MINVLSEKEQNLMSANKLGTEKGQLSGTQKTTWLYLGTQKSVLTKAQKGSGRWNTIKENRSLRQGKVGWYLGWRYEYEYWHRKQPCILESFGE